MDSERADIDAVFHGPIVVELEELPLLWAPKIILKVGRSVLVWW